jgi:hypothetical protein
LQQQLAVDFALDRRRYIYKSGDEEPKGEDGCSVAEATQALGCAISMDLAVQVKREIGQLWTDIQKPPYIDVFPRSLTSIEVWKAVKIMRTVDDELHKLQSVDLPRAYLIAIHFNRAVLHLVFRDPRIRAFRADTAHLEQLTSDARVATNELFPKVAAYIEKEHADEYPASVCKNRDKCNALMAALDALPPAVGPTLPGEVGTQGTLFPP